MVLAIIAAVVSGRTTYGPPGLLLCVLRPRKMNGDLFLAQGFGRVGGMMAAEMTSRLGAYDVLRKSKTFPVSFWAVMENEGRVLIEMADDGVKWVSVEELDHAIMVGDVRLDVEL